MRLFFWIKDTYYNYKLDKADSAFQAKDIIEAERIYQEILDKQPNASEHLAKMYYELGKFHNDELSYLSKLRSLLSNTTFEKDKVSSYLNQLVVHIEMVSEQLFKNRDYNKAYQYLKAIDHDKRDDINFAKKSRLYSLYVHLYAIEFESSYTSIIGLIDEYCERNVENDIENAIIGTVKRLQESNKLDRAYCVSNCLARNGNSEAIKECVNIAYDIYHRGNKSDIDVIDEETFLGYILQNSQSNLHKGLEQFVNFSDKYRNKYISESIRVISSESDAKKAFSIFRNVWKIAPDVSLIQTFAKSSSSIALFVYTYFKENISSLISESNYQIALFKELSLFDDIDYIFSVLEEFKENGLDNKDLKDLYVSKVKSIYEISDENARLSVINRLLKNYSDNSWGIGEKLAIAERAQVTQNYDLSIQLYSELIGLHAKAQPRLAQLYYELSQKESNFSKRRTLVEKAYSFKNSHDPLFDTNEYDKLLINLSLTVHELLKECFANNVPDEAYITVDIFKSYVSECFCDYVKELKLYQDITYVLAKLESLKNEGYDVEIDYKEIVNKIIISSDFEDKYKLEVLSKSIDLYKDDNLSEKFISMSIIVIRTESEVESAVAVFAKSWKQLSDSKLLDAFVNQKYQYHTFIIDFLIEKASILRWKKSLLSDFCDKISTFDNYKYSLSLLDRIAAKGVDVQRFYVANVLKTLPSLSTDDRLLLLNESLAKYSDECLVNEKLVLCDCFVDEGKSKVAERTLTELVGSHELAEPKLAALYYNESKKAKTLDCKRELIRKGLSYHVSHSSIFAMEEYNLVFKKLLSAYTSIISEYFSNKEYSEAYRLCEEFKQYNSKWYNHYIRLRTEALSSLDDIEDKINHICETFTVLDRNGYIVKDSILGEINSLWDILYDLEVEYAKSKSYKDCVQQFNDYSVYITNQCNEEKSKTLQKNINIELIGVHKNYGYKCEQEGIYSDAISSYVILCDIADVRTKTWCKIRIFLCNIKDGKYVEVDEIRKVLASVGFVKEKKDLAYRYSLYLIANRGAKESLSFVTEYLPEESDLIAVCKNECIKEAETLLGILNQTLDRLNKGTATLSDAIKLAENLDEYDSKLSPYLNGVHSKIVSLRPAIQSYILSRCFEDGKFDQALEYLENSGKNWYEDDVYFRNVAIACLGIAESGKLNKSNYKIIISYWLTAVYRDQLFVKSLDYTSWDDSYTFTLDNSLGGSKFDSYDSLPENIGYSEAIEGSVIPISEVQQSLLNRFEIALNDKDEIFRDFFEKQKDAMDSLVKLNMDSPCIIAAPYMANVTKKCLDEIKETLNYEYDNYGGENILKVGILYSIKTGVYSDYQKALNNAKNCVEVAKSMSVTQVRRAFTSSVIDSIQNFSDLYTSFVTEIQNVLSLATKSESSYKKALSVFSIICQKLNSSTLAYIFGNYINQSVVGKLNDGSLDLASGLKDLVSAYNVANSCLQLKNNIGNVLEALVGKYITEANSNDFSVIKSVLSSTGSIFENNFSNALSEEIVLVAIATGHSETIENLTSISAKTVALRNKLTSLKEKAKEISLNIELSELVDRVNSNNMSYSSALNEVTSLYKNNKDNSRIRENLCTLIEMCIKEYLTEANADDLFAIKSLLRETGTEFENDIANTLSDQVVLLAMATGNVGAIDNLASIPAKTIALKNKISSLKAKSKEISLNMELSKIVEKVNNKTMSYSSALQKVHSIYKDNKDNSRVCDNLCVLIGMCIREYVIPDNYGKSTVMSIFNDLKYNKSTTYRVSAQVLKNERQEILNSLPQDVRIIMTGGSAYNSQLNEDGKKLKNALQLYIDLA